MAADPEQNWGCKRVRVYLLVLGWSVGVGCYNDPYIIPHIGCVLRIVCPPLTAAPIRLDNPILPGISQPNYKQNWWGGGVREIERHILFQALPASQEYGTTTCITKEQGRRGAFVLKESWQTLNPKPCWQAGFPCLAPQIHCRLQRKNRGGLGILFFIPI